MISAEIFRNTQGEMVGFTVKNHGSSVVCAGVSMLVLNTVNSIELLTADKFSCDFNDDGGFLAFSLDEPHNRTDGAGILLDSMFLGLIATLEEYPDEIEIKETST